MDQNYFNFMPLIQKGYVLFPVALISKKYKQNEFVKQYGFGRNIQGHRVKVTWL